MYVPSSQVISYEKRKTEFVVDLCCDWQPSRSQFDLSLSINYTEGLREMQMLIDSEKCERTALQYLSRVGVL